MVPGSIVVSDLYAPRSIAVVMVVAAVVVLSIGDSSSNRSVGGRPYEVYVFVIL